MSQIEVDRDGAVLHIALNRPEKKNALTAEMYDALADAVEQSEADAGVRVLLLSGKGEAFTAGNDLVDFLRKPWSGLDRQPPAVRFMFAVANAKKPVVAAVQGLAVGIGVTMLLHCDLVYAAEDARFMAPFVDLGIIPEAGSTVLLPAILGHQRAAEMLMLGSPVAAQRAYEMGLVNAVVPAADLLPVARKAAQNLANKPVVALRVTKQLLRKANHTEVERAMKEEVRLVAERLDSAETREALSAFVEKRKPDFSRF